MDDQDFELGETFDGDGEGAAPTWATGVYVVTAVKLEDGGKSKFQRTDKNDQPIFDAQGQPVFDARWKWHFLFNSVDSKRTTEAQQACVGQVLFRWTSRSLGKGPAGPSNCRAYIEALIGRDLEPGERPRTSWFIGRQAVATVKAVDGKVSEFGLMPYASDDPAPDDAPLGTTTKPAQLPDDRNRVMNDMVDVDDARDLAGIKARIRALRLDTDDEVVDVYNLTHSRIHGHKKPNDAQPALPY